MKPHSTDVIPSRAAGALASGLALALLLTTAGPGAADERFHPEEWLRQHNLGRLTVTTLQSGKPLQPFAARSLEQWEQERRVYEQAYVELIGPWPRERPPLKTRVLEEKRAAKWTRFKVGFATLPSPAAHASEIRAWLFVPTGKTGRLPAIVTLHQTIPQGKDEPAAIKPTLPWLAFATYYAERGYITLAPDMIGFGERTAGGYERTGCEWADARPILDAHPAMTLLGLMLFDVSRCADYLVTRSDVDADRIGVIGHSLGGILVNGVLPLEPRLKVGVASCGYGLFRTDRLFPDRWAAFNSAYLPRLVLYRDHPNDLPIDFHHILALSVPRAHLIQTAMGDTIWTRPAVAEDPFVMKELRRIRAFYGPQAVDNLVAIEPIGGATDRDHGWYPETQRAADALFARVLKAGSAILDVERSHWR
jgi:dienelactone hydrolase